MFGNTGNPGDGKNSPDDLDSFLGFLQKSVQEAKDKAAQEQTNGEQAQAQEKKPGDFSAMFADAELKKLVQDVQQDAADTAMYGIVDMVAGIYNRFIDKKVPEEHAAKFTLEFQRAFFGMFLLSGLGGGRGGLGGLGGGLG